ncbi:hypothetical protein ACFX2F_021663 [Malus domestica]
MCGLWRAQVSDGGGRVELGLSKREGSAAVLVEVLKQKAEEDKRRGSIEAPTLTHLQIESTMKENKFDELESN